MSYDQKALEKLFTKKPDTNEIDNILVAEPEAEPEHTSVEELSAEKQPNLKADGKQIIELPITELNDYPKQLFKPYNDENLKKLETSIRENGVISPLLVRVVNGAYQIVCGHNRKRAAVQAGFVTVPCFVEEMTDDEADIKMVETNLQTRTRLLPSEKGFAYKLKLDAMKHQGIRTDSALCPEGTKSGGVRSDELLASTSDESARQIQRYIRLTYLITPLLDHVDNNILQLKPAVELSYMSVSNQEMVYNFFYVLHKLNIDEVLAKKLKEQSRIEELTEESITTLLPPTQGKTVKQTSKFSIPTKPLMKLLDTSALTKDVEKEILDVLIDYYKKKKQDKE